jgi:FMN phosphatase YigB (HAD superfamily)
MIILLQSTLSINCYNYIMIKHIWFDLDATLTHETKQYRLEHDKFAANLFTEVMNRTDCPLGVEEYRQLRKENDSINSKVFENVAHKDDKFWADNLSRWDNTLLFDYAEHEDVREVLAEFSKKVPISIYTNTSKRRLRNIMKHLGYDASLFVHLMAGENVPERKPSVLGYEYIVELSGLEAGYNVYVGDKVPGDIIPASKVGMQTVLVGSESSEADFSVANISDLRSVLKIG